MQILSFLRAHWQGCIIAVLLLLVLQQAAHNSYFLHPKAAKQAEATISAQAAHKWAADTLYYFRQGQHRENQRWLDSLDYHAEALSPAGSVLLPAQPPRQ